MWPLSLELRVVSWRERWETGKEESKEDRWAGFSDKRGRSASSELCCPVWPIREYENMAQILWNVLTWYSTRSLRGLATRSSSRPGPARLIVSGSGSESESGTLCKRLDIRYSGAERGFQYTQIWHTRFTICHIHVSHTSQQFTCVNHTVSDELSLDVAPSKDLWRCPTNSRLPP